MIQSIFKFFKKSKQQNSKVGEQVLRLEECINLLRNIEGIISNIYYKNGVYSGEASENLRTISEITHRVGIKADKSHFKYEYEKKV